jgi:hypothetical protein
VSTDWIKGGQSRLFPLVHSHFYFKSCKSTIYNLLIVSGTVRNFTNNTPLCYSFLIALKLTPMNVTQTNTSENQQSLYSQHVTCCSIRHIIHLLTHTTESRLLLPYRPPSMSVANRFFRLNLSPFHPSCHQRI